MSHVIVTTQICVFKKPYENSRGSIWDQEERREGTREGNRKMNVMSMLHLLL